MKNAFIVIKKQLKDTLKNKAILIQFILFPTMALILENTISIPGMDELFFTKLFSIMYIGMAPLTAVASIIAEEKEKNTLRVLMMANVKPWQYLLGVGVYVWLICMVGALLMAISIPSSDILYYISVMGVGFLISILAGACIGIYSKNQMVATSVVMPVMLILAFLPMIAIFNEKIAKFAELFYTQQLMGCVNNMASRDVTTKGVLVISINAAILLILFAITFKRKGLE